MENGHNGKKLSEKLPENRKNHNTIRMFVIRLLLNNGIIHSFCQSNKRCNEYGLR